MAFTKLYLTSATAPFTPTQVRGTWDDSAGFVTLGLQPSKVGGGSAATVARAETNAGAGFKVLLWRGVSIQLAAQTIAGSLNVVIGALESAADADLYWAIHVYVTEGDTDNVRTTLLANYTENTTNEWPTTATARALQVQVPLTSAPIADGDRIVVEIGYIARNATATSKTGTLNYGTVDGSGDPLGDLTVGSTSVTTLAGFLSFSQSILEYGTNVVATAIAGPTVAGVTTYGGFGFRPKAMLVWSTGQTADGITDGWLWSIGAATATHQGVRGCGDADNVTPTDNHGVASQSNLIWLVDNAGVTLLLGHLAGFTDDGFMMNWVTSDGTSRLFDVLLIGGANVQVASGILTHPVQSAGDGLTQDVSVGFTPDLVLFSPGIGEVASSANVSRDNDGSTPGFGFATRNGTLNSHALASTLDGIASTVPARRQKTDRCVAHVNGYFGGVTADLANEAHIATYLPDGFRLTWDETDGLVGGDPWRSLWIAMAGLQCRIFNFTKPTSATTKAVTGIGFRPGALLLQTVSNTANAGTDTSFGAIQIGAADGVRQVTAALIQQSAQNPSANVRTHHSARICKTTGGAATGASATVIAEATLRSFDSDGFTLSYSVSSATAHQVIGLAIGGVVAPPGASAGCTGGGAVAAGSNAPAPASLDGAQIPLVYLTLQTASGEQRYGRIPIVDSTYAEARILTISPIRRALSDWFGGFQTGTCTVTLADTDRAIRALHVAGTLLNRRVDIYLTSKAILDAAGAPRRMGQFIVRRYQPNGDFTFTLDLEDFLGSQLGDFASTKSLPNRPFGPDDFPTIANPVDHATDPGNPALVGKMVAIGYGILSDTDLGAAAVGVVPCQYVGTRQLGTGGAEKWDEYVVFGHAIAHIQEWFAGASPVDARIKMDEGTEGVDFLIPGRAGWIARLGANTYVDYNSRRYTVIYARGPRSVAAREGRVPITLNVCAIEDVGDGTGDVIDSLPIQALHFINNFVLGTWIDGSGTWAGIPTIGSPAYARINTDSFEAADVIAQARLTGGYLGAWILGHDGTPMALFDILQRLCVNADIDLGINRDGQIVGFMLDPAAGAVKTLTDILDMHRGTLQTPLGWDYLSNRYVYQFQRRYIQPVTNTTPAEGALLPGAVVPPEGDWLANGEDEDATSITDHQEEKPTAIDFSLVRDPDTAADIIASRLARTKSVPALPEFQTGLQGTDVDLGDVIALTAAAGLSGSGWTDRVVRVREVEVDTMASIVTLRGQDIADL